MISDDFNIKPIDLNDLDKKEDELGTSEALIRGVVSKLKELGYNVGGFKAFITSDVLMGAGLSSSAAFESIIGTIIDGLYNDMKIDMVTIAKVGQYAENVYFGRLTNWLKEQKELPLDIKYYLCGNPEMVVEVRDILVSKGISFNNIISEIYF